MICSVHGFHHIRPRHELPQEKILNWIAEAHHRAEEKKEGTISATLREEIKDRLFRLGCGPDKIQSRGLHLSDVDSDKWEEMELYPVTDLPTGKGFAARSAFFEKEMDPIFEAFYPEGARLPSHLIHVTCTGYVAPSPAQKLVAKRNEGQRTRVTHAYHMGCYAAFAALRMGGGFLYLPSSSDVDVVHTELGSLHMHPLKHSTEQLMVQSLFADGFIKYTLSQRTDLPHLKVLALQEEILSESASDMTWRCEDHGLVLTLSREVPLLLSRALPDFLTRLQTQVSSSSSTYFAVHPGGPKILDYVEKFLHLSPHQMRHSRGVMQKYGNMSSATLPHIWQEMLDDPLIEKGAQIVNLAFGPGLSISGGILEKGGAS